MPTLEAQDQAATGASVYRRLLGYTAKFWGIFLLAAVAMAVFAFTDTAFAYLISQLVKSMSPEEAGATSDPLVIRGNWLPLSILGLFLLRGVAGFGSSYGLAWIGRQVIMTLREEVFDKFLRLPTSFFDLRSGGELLAKLAYNIEQIAAATSDVVTVLIRDSLTIIGLVIYMTYLSPPLSAFLFIVAPVIAFLIKTLGGIFRRYSARIQQSMGDVIRITGDAVQSHRIIKIFGGQDYENNRFGQANEKNRRLNMRLVASRAAGDAMTGLVIAAGVSGVVYFATRESVRPGDLGDFVGFLTAMVFLMRPLRALTGINAAIQRGIAAGSSVFSILDEAEESRQRGLQSGACRGPGGISSRRVQLFRSQGLGPQGYPADGASGGNAGHRRPVRQREVYVGEPAAPIL